MLLLKHRAYSVTLSFSADPNILRPKGNWMETSCKLVLIESDGEMGHNARGKG
jgi:hypothetical protein